MSLLSANHCQTVDAARDVVGLHSRKAPGVSSGGSSPSGAFKNTNIAARTFVTGQPKAVSVFILARHDRIHLRHSQGNSPASPAHAVSRTRRAISPSRSVAIKICLWKQVDVKGTALPEEKKRGLPTAATGIERRTKTRCLGFCFAGELQFST